MKKTMKVLSLMLVVVLLLASCGKGKNGPQDLSTKSAKAEDAVVSMFEALKDKNHEAVLSVTDPASSDVLPFDGSAREVYADELSEKLSYEIMSADPREGVDNKETDVIVKVNIPDMSVIFPKVFTAVLEASFSMDIAQASEEDIKKVIRENMDTMVAASDVAMTDFTVAVLVKELEGKWVVVPDTALTNAILGGLEDVTSSMLTDMSEDGQSVDEVETAQ